MRRLHPHLYLVPALGIYCAAAMAATPAGLGTWTEMGTGSITTQCTSGFTCTTGTSDSGFLQRQINDSTGTIYIQTIVTGDGLVPVFPLQGTITDADSGEPIPAIKVSIFYAGGNPVDLSTPILTDNLGHFISPELPVGEYLVRADGNQNFQAELYDQQACLGLCDVTTGSAVAVKTDSTPDPVNFSLARGSQISGSITDSDTGMPLPDITVVIMAENGVPVTSGITDTNGAYVSGTALPPGKYFAHTINSSAYIDERYNGERCVMSCDFLDDTPVEIPATTAATDVDFSLEKGGQISGMIVDAINDVPLVDITVIVDDANGSPVMLLPTDSSGLYMSRTGLPAGQYYLRTANKDAFINQIYTGIVCLAYDCDVKAGNQVTFRHRTAGHRDAVQR